MGEDLYAQAVRAAIHELLRTIRGGLDREDGPAPYPGRGGPGGGAVGRPRGSSPSQQEIDFWTGYSVGYYAQLERGVARHPTEDYLRRLAEVMHLTNDQFVALCQFALSRRPGRPLHPEEGLSIWDAWVGIVEEMPGIVYIQDRAFNVVVSSPAWRDMFPGDPPENSMAWMLFSAEARSYTLIDWEAWVIPIIATVVSKWADNPEDETLAAIYRQILRDPLTRPLLQRALRQARPHPAGARRRVRHALLGEGILTVYTAELAGSPGAWLVVCRFYADGEPVPPPGRVSSPFGPCGGGA